MKTSSLALAIVSCAACAACAADSSDSEDGPLPTSDAPRFETTDATDATDATAATDASDGGEDAAGAADTAGTADASDTAPDVRPAVCEPPEPAASCDGGAGCFRWSLRGIEIPPGDKAVITWRFESFCSDDVDEVRFGFTPSAEPLAPADLATFTSAEASVWTVAHEPLGCAGFRFVRRTGAAPQEPTTFVIELAPGSVEPDTVFVNEASAGATTAVFATRAAACFVFSD